MSAGVYCNIFCPLKKRRTYLVTVYELIQMQALTILSVNRCNIWVILETTDGTMTVSVMFYFEY